MLDTKNGERDRRRSPWTRRLLILLLALAIFQLGLLVGDGRLSVDLTHQKVVVNKQLPAKLDYSQVDAVYQSLKTNYNGKLTQQQLIDGLKHGLAESTKDPYTVYFTAKEAKNFSDQLNNSFSGVGAQLGQDADGNIEVIAPIEGLPAAKAGLQAKDIIASVDGASTSGQSIDEVVSKVRGKAGTKVKLQIVRNKTQPLEFTITRQDIKIPSVKTKILDGNVGYVQISTFADDTTDLAQKAAQEFKDKQVSGVILDLRNDPGGLLDAAISVSSLWLPSGQTVLTQKGTTGTQTSQAAGDDLLQGIPTVVLINSGSASASEITAGALHDNKAAYLIGEKSYGKGVVQDVICITGQRASDGSCPADELKVTVAGWFRPNGTTINHKGITPDKTVKITPAEAKAGTDSQLQAAQDYLKK